MHVRSFRQVYALFAHQSAAWKIFKSSNAFDALTSNSTAAVPSSPHIAAVIQCLDFNFFFLSLITVSPQDFSPTCAIIFSYTVHVMAAIMVLLSDRGTAPLKKPWIPCST